MLTSVMTILITSVTKVCNLVLKTELHFTKLQSVFVDFNFTYMDNPPLLKLSL
jgi:hypothetical protein